MAPSLWPATSPVTTSCASSPRAECRCWPPKRMRRVSPGCPRRVGVGPVFLSASSPSAWRQQVLLAVCGQAAPESTGLALLRSTGLLLEDDTSLRTRGTGGGANSLAAGRERRGG